MALRPLILKIHFYRPGSNGKTSTSSALAHLDYMGNPQKEELVRAGEHDDRDSAAIHAAYMAGRPGSTGYIGPNEHDLPNPQAIAAELRDHKGPIWRAIISVTEADARAMGGDLMDRPAWEEAARSVLPRMADAVGISRDNLAWTAAMHRKDGHPHLHLLFWDRSASRDRGKLSDGERRDVRRLWVQSLYRPERERLGLEKNLLREELLAGGRAELAQVGRRNYRVPKEQEIPHPPRLSTSQAQELAERLQVLRANLPGAGRVALKYMPPEVKDQVRQVADWLVTQVPDYRRALDRYVEIAGEMAQHYSDNPQAHQAATDKARADIRDRLAQKVLQSAVRMDRAAKREAVTSIAFAAIRGTEGAPEGLRDQVYAEIQRTAGLRGDARHQAAADLARRILADPALAGAKQEYERAGGSGEEMEAGLARSIERAADYVSFQEANLASRLAAGWWQGLMQTVRAEERAAERLAAEEEVQRAKRRQAEQELMR